MGRRLIGSNGRIVRVVRQVRQATEGVLYPVQTLVLARIAAPGLQAEPASVTVSLALP